MADARVVDDFVGDGDLPAEIILFENQHAIAGASEIQAGGESRRAATDDNNVIQIASVDLGHDMELLTYAYAPAGGLPRSGWGSSPITATTPSRLSPPAPASGGGEATRLTSLPARGGERVGDPQPTLTATDSPPAPAIRDGLQPQPVVLACRLAFAYKQLCYLLDNSARQ